MCVLRRRTACDAPAVCLFLFCGPVRSRQVALKPETPAFTRTRATHKKIEIRRRDTVSLSCIFFPTPREHFSRFSSDEAPFCFPASPTRLTGVSKCRPPRMTLSEGITRVLWQPGSVRWRSTWETREDERGRRKKPFFFR